MKILQCYIIIIVSLFLYGCRAKHGNYEITMTGNYMETSFPLLNGVQIDELQVTSLSKDKTPYEFYLKQSFTVLRKSNTSNKDLIKNVIFFDRPNPNYYWQSDSTWGIFDISVSKYKYRGSLSKKGRFDYSYQKQYEIFPLEFKPQTWYLIDFKPANIEEKHHEFMYVDGNSRFIFYKLHEVGEKS